MLNRDRLVRAFTLLGEDLARRGVFVELAIYGGSALMLQFAWRSGTEDVDAVVRPGYDEAVLAPSVAHVGRVMGLAPEWLNDAVGMFTPLHEGEDLFEVSGCYPAGDRPGLRVLLATPRYLLAMKLKALATLDRGDRDLRDARALAGHLGTPDVDALRTLYASIHGEEPGLDIVRRFPAVLRGGQVRPGTLAEVAERSRANPDWDHHLRDFLDAFYASDGDLPRQAAMLADAPALLGDAKADAFLGGVGEHLARRWGAPIPPWVRSATRYLQVALFVPDDPSVRDYLLAVSPVAFRARLIFTGPDPLQRARFPYHRGVVRLPMTYPAPAADP